SVRFSSGLTSIFWSCFFFQTAAGIRDFHVTGVQTCALPILPFGIFALLYFQVLNSVISYFINTYYTGIFIDYPSMKQLKDVLPRSEERRVGKGRGVGC